MNLTLFVLIIFMFSVLLVWRQTLSKIKTTS